MQRHDAIVSVGLLILVAANADAGTLQIVDDLPGKFMDISQTGGTALNLGDDEEVDIGTFPGNFVFLTGPVVVANNGGLGFGNEVVSDLTPGNEPIPSTSAFLGGQAALVFWDDIDDKQGDVFFAQFADLLIVQWNNRNLNGTGDTVRFQIQIFTNPGPSGIFAQFIFDDIEQPAANGGASATIGYQDGAAGFGDVQWSFNTAAAVANGTVLSLVIPSPAGPVPAVSRWSLGVLSVLLVAAGVIVIRRGQHPTRASY